MIVVVPVDPPHEALVPADLLEHPSVSAADATALYRAMVADVARAVDSSGGDLLINYRDEESLSDDVAGAIDDPEATVRGIVADALEGTDEVRFERQVGSSYTARMGNTVTHLLEREDAQSVGILEPTAALVGRTQIDGVAMALRRNEVVLGPSHGGGIYLAAFSEPIDFTDAFAEPAVSTLAMRADEADLGIGFAPRVPTVAEEQGLAGTCAEIEARRIAGRAIPVATASVIEDRGL
ncbi:hypothetical protein [Natronosalvus vescus]|uniref:hypothetical protein n=1 Tax=Natronosalvus vescus TaxID=2953881 RepID=UPI0020918564|nr:hypothetical protein [Natronosalvus vescus]